MAGLYIHIPFCKSRCIYCGFYSTTALNMRQLYIDAVCREMEIRRSESSIGTIYLGGGTPSQLTTEQLGKLFESVYNHYQIEKNSEVTIEMNPDDVTSEYAATLSQQGINRVSMGAQTFDDRRLRFLRRRHSAAQVAQAVSLLREAGIQNISIDLMYGFPGETLDDWIHDIDAALALNVEHISAYCLMVEEGTVLYEQFRDKSLEFSVDEELERQMYFTLIDRLTAAGYEHYEISNFAKQDFRSKHNSNYWCDIPYLGLGAAAHSYDGHCRQWNVSNIRVYIEAIERGEVPCEKEILDDNMYYNDRITTALRTKEGLCLETLSEKYRNYCLQEAQRYIDQGWLTISDGHLTLTRQGLFVSDDIMSSLIYI